MFDLSGLSLSEILLGGLSAVLSLAAMIVVYGTIFREWQRCRGKTDRVDTDDWHF